MLKNGLSLCWTSLLRRRLRSVVTGAGVAVAVGMLFALVSFQRGYQRGVSAELDRLGAHLLVVPKGCPYDAASIALHGASWPCYLKSVYLGSVRAAPHVAVAAPVLMNALYDDASGAQVVYCGVEPGILALKRGWRLTGAFPSRPQEILVGSEIARERGWHPGQSVALPGLKGAAGTVSAILSPSASADDLFIFLPLSSAQKLFERPGELTHILVRLDSPENLDVVVGELRGCDAGLEMTVVPLAHLFQTIQSLVQSTRLLLGSVALVALLCAGAGVSNTILMAVSERTREIGVLRALGASRGAVFGLIWGETALLCLISGAIGLLGGLLGAGALESALRARLPFVPHDALLHPETRVMGFCLAVALLLGSLAALLPAWRAARLAPSEALRA